MPDHAGPPESPPNPAAAPSANADADALADFLGAIEQSGVSQLAAMLKAMTGSTVSDKGIHRIAQAVIQQAMHPDPLERARAEERGRAVAEILRSRIEDSWWASAAAFAAGLGTATLAGIEHLARRLPGLMLGGL